jgi:hypothetical protein
MEIAESNAPVLAVLTEHVDPEEVLETLIKINCNKR